MNAQPTHRQRAVAEVLRTSGGLISAKAHPDLRGCIDWLVRMGRLRSILPGVYVDASRHLDPDLRIAAAALWSPEGIIVGAAAARFSFWPTIGLDEVELAHRTGRTSKPGYRVHRRSLPPEYVLRRSGISYSCPALTAIDLVRTTGDAEAIDIALRTRAITLTQLRSVFAELPRRRGNNLCARLIEDSRDGPWSPPERTLHRMLRAAGIEGWVANKQVRVGNDTYAADLRFDHLKLAIEVDGFGVHSRRGVFENDRLRNNAFVLDGWTVLHFTPRQIYDQPELVMEQILGAIAMLMRS